MSIRNKLSILSVALMLIFPVIAKEKNTFKKASTSIVEIVVQECKALAQEEKIEKIDLNFYMIQCVNDELEANKFQRVIQTHALLR